jgi:GrpB-like predicted nucleotidyltransferase (UPF0157 family)
LAGPGPNQRSHPGNEGHCYRRDAHRRWCEKVAIIVVDHDPAWAQRFEVEKTRITTALGERALAVEHIGSTSVPDLAAKPIVDICVVVADSSDEATYLPDLESAGYLLRVREPDWHEHRMLRTTARDVHVHVYTVGSSEIVRNLAFRDWLRGNDEDRALYESTKRTLAEQDWPTMQHYADAKSDVIETILVRALGSTASGVPRRAETT